MCVLLAEVSCGINERIGTMVADELDRLRHCGNELVLVVG